LEYVGGIFPIANDGKDVRVELRVVTRDQVGEQIVAVKFVHPSILLPASPFVDTDVANDPYSAANTAVPA
jgi:hypothetical protein